MTRGVDRRTVLRTGALAAVAGLPSVAGRTAAERGRPGASNSARGADDEERRALVHSGTDNYDVSDGNEGFVDVAVRPSGGRVAVGAADLTTDGGESREVVVVFATDEAGERQWMDTMRHYKYGGPAGVAATPDGGCVACWARGDPDELFGVQTKLYRYDDAGNVLWKKDVGEVDVNSPAALVELDGDKYAIVGSEREPDNDSAAWLAVFDDRGNKYVDERYPGSGEHGEDAVQTVGGGYAILAKTYRDDDLSQVYVTSVDDAGRVEWERTVEFESPFPKAVGAAPDGGVVATGQYTEEIDGENVWQGFFTRIDGQGTEQWTTTVTDPDVDHHPEYVQQAPGGGFEFVGERYDGRRDTWLGTVNEDGIVSTTKVISMESSLGSGKPTPTEDGGFFLAGSRYDHGEENDYMTVARLVRNEPPEPAIDYSPESPTTADEIELSAAETVDPNGNIVTHRWDVTGDGETDYLGDTVVLEPDEAREYEITLEVEDADGATATAETTIVVEREPTPTPTATATPTDSGGDGGSGGGNGGAGSGSGGGGDGGDSGDGGDGRVNSPTPGFGAAGAAAALGLGALARRLRRED